MAGGGPEAGTNVAYGVTFSTVFARRPRFDTTERERRVRLKKLIAASALATATMLPGSAAWAGGLIDLGNVEIVDDICTNVNINLGVEINKFQNCN